MGKNFRETLSERLQDPEFAEEWEALDPEKQIMKAIIEGRKNQNLTQTQLAEATGIYQTDISKLENGTGNPSIKTLERLAAGMNMKLEIKFVPKTSTSQQEIAHGRLH